MISPNWTIVIQGIVFLCALLVLNRFVFQPFIGVLTARRERVEQHRRMAAQAEALAQEMVTRYDGGLRDARLVAAQERQELKRHSLEQESQLLEQARREALSLLQDMRRQIQEDLSRARQELRHDARAFSVAIAEKVLGRALEP